MSFPKVSAVTPVLDTAIYAAGDYIAKVECKNFFAKNAGAANLISLAVIDEAKQKAAFDILFFDADPTVASAVNAAIDIADSEMTAKFIGHLAVATGDYDTDLAGASLATKSNIQLLLQGSGVSQSPSQSVFLVLVSRGTPTYAASSLTIKLGAIRY
jgi:hypothetical protein